MSMDFSKIYNDFNRSRIRFQWILIRFIFILIGVQQDFNGFRGIGL